MRVATRLMELGVVTAEQGMELFHTGRFPQANELESAQRKFVEQREKGYFNPIVGGIPMIDDDKIEESTSKPTSGMPGRPEGSEDQFSRANIQGTIYEIESLRNVAFTKLRDKLKVGKKGFSKDQEKMVDKLCESVVCSTEKENWSDQIISCVNDFNVIEKLGTLDGVLDVSESHKLELYPSAILYHSNERN